jgi:hypothetical protein
MLYLKYYISIFLINDNNWIVHIDYVFIYISPVPTIFLIIFILWIKYVTINIFYLQNI